ncbi:MAG: hypothetical protein QNJ45_18825 [Ardenticatenaceae bacterium]|nr:hypothetical protein [Ardenticatenaceae bacterium]
MRAAQVKAFQTTTRSQRVAWHDYHLSVKVLTRFYNFKTSFLIRGQENLGGSWHLKLHTDPLITTTAIPPTAEKKWPLIHILQKYQPTKIMMGEVEDLLINEDFLAVKLLINMEDSSFSWWLVGQAHLQPELPFLSGIDLEKSTPMTAPYNLEPSDRSEKKRTEEKNAALQLEVLVFQPLKAVHAPRFKKSFAAIAKCKPGKIHIDGVFNTHTSIAILITVHSKKAVKRILDYCRKHHQSLMHRLKITPFHDLGYPRQLFWETINNQPLQEEDSFIKPSISLSQDIST